MAGAFTLATATGLADAWTAELAQIRAQATRYASPYQQEFVILDRQRLQHVTLPWRERFAGYSAAVHLPYLDGALLEFLHRLPPEALAGKRLFNDTLRELAPGLYRVSLARSSGYVTDWHAELITHREAIKEELLSGPSRLDEVIEPQFIRAVLDGLSASGGRSRLRARVQQTLGTLRRSHTGQRLFGQTRIRSVPVSPGTWLLRVLTLRVLDTERRD